MHTLGSLFAGIGGFDLGFERLGFRTAWQVEINPHSQAVLHQAWPNVLLHGDICAVDPADLEPVDVITFGSPCQDLSQANVTRSGFNGSRSGLFYEATRIIRHLQPRFAIWENVAGAFTSNDGRDFLAALAALVECGATDIAWRLLDGQYFDVPQKRERVITVADFGGQSAASVLDLSDSRGGHPRTWPTPGALPASAPHGGTTIFRKSRRPQSAQHAESWVITEVGNTLNLFDVGPGRETHLVVENGAARWLTAREWERMMGFPDDWTLTSRTTDTIRKKQVGNAVPVPLAAWLANNILEAS